ncbi:tyrosine-type recombinase/integrase [Aquirufa nivalisilvae]
MTTKIKTSEHLEEHELNKLLKYLYQNEQWTYYLFVRLGVSTALRYSDLSKITWSMVLHQDRFIIKEKKTGKVREIPIQPELSEKINMVYEKMDRPSESDYLIPLHIRTINKQIKLHAKRAGLKKVHLSSHSLRKTFGREVYRRNGESESSLVKLSLLFNHSSTAITRVYLSITKEEVQNLYQMQDLFVY